MRLLPGDMASGKIDFEARIGRDSLATTRHTNLAAMPADYGMNDFRHNSSVSRAAAELPTERIGLIWLVVAALGTILIWRLPYGNYVLYPFTILATWFHEMGHGLTALLTGGHFDRLLIYPDGSGLAYHSAPASDGFLWGRIRQALVAAGGPMGPPLAGAALILGSRRFATAHYSLLLMGGLLLLSAVLWVRSAFGLGVIPVLGLLVLAIALRAPRWVQAFTVQFLGVQACISTFHQLDYLFSPGGVIGGEAILSDSSQMARNLLLPYWFWGGLMALASLLLLLQSLRVAYWPHVEPSVPAIR